MYIISATRNQKVTLISPINYQINLVLWQLEDYIGSIRHSRHSSFAYSYSNSPPCLPYLKRIKDCTAIGLSLSEIRFLTLKYYRGVGLMTDRAIAVNNSQHCVRNTFNMSNISGVFCKVCATYKEDNNDIYNK